MLLIKIYSIIAALPAIYSIKKLIRKQEFNIFDFITLFHTLFFCVIPFKSNIEAYKWLDSFLFEQRFITTIFFYYIIFICLMLLVNIYWTNRYNHKISIINITYYVKKFPKIKVSYIMLIFLGINIAIAGIWYLPQASYIAFFQETNITSGNEVTPLFLLYDSVFSFCVTITTFLIVKGEVTPIKRHILYLIAISFIVILLFMPRRTFLFYLIQLVIILYSTHRTIFTIRNFLLGCLFSTFLITIYFPFYNIMRFSVGRFDIENPVSSIIEIIEDTRKEFKTKKDDAQSMSDGRSLNLYYALYRIIKFDESPSYGRLLISAIDHALPKIINPNKGEGTEKILEKKMNLSTDQADSLLLFAYGDFGFIFGTFYSLLLYLLLIYTYSKINHLFSIMTKRRSVLGLFIISCLISLSWNVEGRIDAALASFVRLIIISFIFVVITYSKVIYLKVPHK